MASFPEQYGFRDEGKNGSRDGGKNGSWMKNHMMKGSTSRICDTIGQRYGDVFRHDTSPPPCKRGRPPKRRKPLKGEAVMQLVYMFYLSPKCFSTKVSAFVVFFKGEFTNP